MTTEWSKVHALAVLEASCMLTRASSTWSLAFYSVTSFLVSSPRAVNRCGCLCHGSIFAIHCFFSLSFLPCAWVFGLAFFMFERALCFLLLFHF